MVDVLRCDTLTALGFRHGFSLRMGGASAGPYASLNLGRGVGDRPEHVAHNHLRLATAVGYAPAGLYETSQIHGAEVVFVDGSEPPERVRQRQADALVATTAGVAVGVRTADCLGVLLADPATGVAAAVHSGWRGTVARIAPETIAQLNRRLGVSPARLHAVLLPHIRGCCFEVGDDVAEQLVGASGACDVVRTDGSRPHVDLGRVVHAQLCAAGLDPAHVHSVPGCTCCEPERFFSHRRDGAPCGRHVAAIVAA